MKVKKTHKRTKHMERAFIVRLDAPALPCASPPRAGWCPARFSRVASAEIPGMRPPSGERPPHLKTCRGAPAGASLRTTLLGGARVDATGGAAPDDEEVNGPPAPPATALPPPPLALTPGRCDRACCRGDDGIRWRSRPTAPSSRRTGAPAGGGCFDSRGCMRTCRRQGIHLQDTLRGRGPVGREACDVPSRRHHAACSLRST